MKLQDELGDTSTSDLDFMLGQLELSNLLEGNRRSGMDSTDVNMASPALHARGHSSPNQNNNFGRDSSSDDLTELTLRYSQLIVS